MRVRYEYSGKYHDTITISNDTVRIILTSVQNYISRNLEPFFLIALGQ